MIINPTPVPLPGGLVWAIAAALVVRARVTCLALRTFDFALITDAPVGHRES
jgi:hypothetical protein